VGKRRAEVRNQLQAAARQRGLALRFRPDPGAALVFHVKTVPAKVPALTPAATPTPTPAEMPVSRPSDARRPRGRPVPPRATARDPYEHQLPCWMVLAISREGDLAGHTMTARVAHDTVGSQ
jgi:hypothetical protein